MKESIDRWIKIQDLWAKYEDIAMHFNDLLMRLRLQSLGGIAAISTAVGVLANGKNTLVSLSWFVAAMIFVAMTLFWIAIWCLDFLYYNRLLRGAASALAQIESETQKVVASSGINMSTLIENEFNQPLLRRDVLHFRGVLLFYGIVLIALVCGALPCLVLHWRAT